MIKTSHNIKQFQLNRPWRQLRWPTLALFVYALLNPQTSYADSMCSGDSFLNYSFSSDELFNDPKYDFSGLGGVSLNKTLTLLNGVDNIKGAAYDPKKGEIVFVGAGTVSQTIDLDDLVVAVRTVYSVDANGFSIDPGVSFDAGNTAFLVDGKMKVRFSGATSNTAFGQILYDADYILKKLGQGVDENSNLLINNSALAALGYMSAAERFITNGIDPGSKTLQYWITPKDIVMQAYNQAGTSDKSFVFDDTLTSMQVCVKIYNGDGSIDLADSCVSFPASPTPLQAQAKAFADNITANYDAYSNVSGFEALKRLKRLGKIVGVVRWLRDNNIPVDLSFMADYVPKNVTTPQTVKLLQLCKSPTSNTVLPAGSGPYVPGTCGTKIIGGVTYDKENTQVATPAQSQVITDGLANTGRLLNPQIAGDMDWNFSSGGSSYTAFAQIVAPSGKDGNFRFNSVDLSLPNQAGQSLSFTRYYDSFSGLVSGFGPGWSELPFSLRFPESEGLFCTDGSANCTVTDPNAMIANGRIFMVDRISGRTIIFDLAGVIGFTNPSGQQVTQPYYVTDKSNDWIYEHPSGFFIYEQRNANGVVNKVSWFLPRNGAQGAYTADPVFVGTDVGTLGGDYEAGVWLEYIYDVQNRLVGIEGDFQKRLNIEYSGDRISRAYFTSDAGTREVTYTYTTGRLATANRSGRITSYTYTDVVANDPASGIIATVQDSLRSETIVSIPDTDLEHRSEQIRPEGNTALNKAVFYDRPTGIMRTTETLPDSSNRVVTVQRDSKGRHQGLTRTAVIGGASQTLTSSMAYLDTTNPLAGPTRVTDVRNQATQYSYDLQGNVKGVTDALSRVTTIERGIDTSDSFPVIVVTDPKGRASAQKFDGVGRLIASYRRISVTSKTPLLDGGGVDTGMFRFTFTYTPGYAQTYRYDIDSGVLQTVANDASALTGIYPWLSGDESAHVTKRNSFGQPERVLSASRLETKYSYDGLSRLVSTQGPADVMPTSLNYFSTGLAQDQLSSVETPLGEAKIAVDVKERVRTVTDARGVSTTYFNNIKNQIEKVVEVSPDGTQVLTTQYFYDVFGKLSYKILPNGTRVNYTYDNFDRLTAMIEAEGTDANPGNNTAPAFSQVPPASNTVSLGGTFSFDMNASDANGDTATYTLVVAPAGMVINPSTGLISWVPGSVQTGTHLVIAQVDDGKGGVTTDTFTVTVNDAVNKCTGIANPDARDTDNDGYGNKCDPDLNNDGVVNFADLALFKSFYGTSNANADFDGDGIVGQKDLEILKSKFGGPPGPSGVAP